MIVGSSYKRPGVVFRTHLREHEYISQLDIYKTVLGIATMHNDKKDVRHASYPKLV